MHLNSERIGIVHNIISPYKTVLFNELFKICKGIHVIYMAETEGNRDWSIRRDELQFPHEILFDGSLDGVSKSRVAIATWKHLNSLKPDVVIIGGYSYLACWAALFWAKTHKTKTILWSSSNQDDKGRSFLKEKLKSFFVKRCDAADVYGVRSGDYLVRLGMQRNRIFTKGNTTNNAFYYDQTMRLRAKRDLLCERFGIRSHNFLYIGRFSQEKNILHLLDAYRRVEAADQWGLILVGSGPQRKEIEDYIGKHAIKNVLLAGFRQKEKIPEFLAVSDILVLPSVSEPWGLVVNEAMAAGLPVLVSKRCGCYPDIVRENVNGFAFDPFDETELYGIMRAIVDGRCDLESMGKASLELIDGYSPEKAAKVVARTIEYVLEELRKQE
jgi:glycosyltransferase involved in cell wall biosynthesis